MERIRHLSSHQLTLLADTRLDHELPDAEDVFHALTGYRPRPWQAQLLRMWIANGVDAWGGTCAVPTGLGKSMLPIIALIASAYVDRPVRRIVYVVNRRIVVDQTYVLAEKAAARLRDAATIEGPDGLILRAFRRALFMRLGLNSANLPEEAKNAPSVHLLRGGTGDRLLKIDSPVTPTIIVSTVDQAGSRLLMRGYGVSRRAWPIQGGLLAYDSLWIIDEAHTARALVTTIERVRTAIRESDGAQLGRPLVVLEASATLGGSSSIPFTPGDEQEARISGARKNVRLKFLEQAPKADDLARSASVFISDALDDPDVIRAAVVVNSINGARAVFKTLTKDLGGHPRAPRLLLLIGAIREQERRKLMKRDEFMDLNPDVRDLANPVVVVATQTVETGPDFDFDALMSETAALDALIQRFGRVNRRGTSPSPRGLIWGCPSDPSAVYGTAPQAASIVLRSWGEDVINFSPLDIAARLHAVDPATVADAWTPTMLPEALMGARVRDLGRTYPANRQETDIAWYLHGERAGEVEIIWRNDVADLIAGGNTTHAIAYADALPPEPGESLSISTRAARAFLRNNSKQSVSDGIDESGSKDDTDDSVGKGTPRRALARRNGDETRFVSANEVRTGDVLIVPASYGWYDEYGFYPGFSHLPATFASDDSLVMIVEDDELPERDEDDTYTLWSVRCIKALQELLADSDDDKKRNFERAMSDAASIRQSPHPTQPGNQIFRVITEYACDQKEDSGSSRPITLAEHHRGVGNRVRLYAEALGLSDALVAILEFAGRTHDLGKADPEFQERRLGNTDPGRILSKSKPGRAAISLLYRHECASAKMVQSEHQLVRHLVGTHHGYGRPGFPFEDLPRTAVSYEQDGRTWAYDGSQDLRKLGGWWREQFAALQTRYSPWGIAYLEGIMRLADHRTSQSERKKIGIADAT